MIDSAIRDKLHAYLAGIINNGFGLARKVGGVADHVHILADVKPTFAPADLLRDLKANSSRWIHEAYPAKGKFAWQAGYGVFSVSMSSVPDVVAYIERQE